MWLQFLHKMAWILNWGKVTQQKPLVSCSPSAISAIISIPLHLTTYTSGGLMVCLSRDKAEAFCAEIEVCIIIVYAAVDMFCNHFIHWGSCCCCPCFCFGVAWGWVGWVGLVPFPSKPWDTKKGICICIKCTSNLYILLSCIQCTCVCIFELAKLFFESRIVIFCESYSNILWHLVVFLNEQHIPVAQQYYYDVLYFVYFCPYNRLIVIDYYMYLYILLV